jgi:hypothetical protein
MVMIVEQLVEWMCGRGNQSTWWKPASVQLCPPQIPHDLAHAGTWAAMMGSWRLTAWGMAWCSSLLPKQIFEQLQCYRSKSLTSYYEAKLCFICLLIPWKISDAFCTSTGFKISSLKFFLIRSRGSSLHGCEHFTKVRGMHTQQKRLLFAGLYEV